MKNTELIKELKRYISKNNNKQEKRIVNTNEVAIDDCYAGVIENEFIDTLEYEVYVFVEYKKEVVSPLLYKAFKDKESAKEYYDELNSIIKCKNLGDLRVKCQNWGQIEDKMRTNWGQIGTCIEEMR